jgi:chemotaxis protein MotA
MLAIVGALIVMVSVFGGFLLEGGHIEVLFQPIELLIIGGAGVGSLVIGGSPALFKQMLHQVLGVLKGAGPSKNDYIELMKLLFELTKTAKANPLSIEAHVDNPEGSEIFKKFPTVLKNHHAIEFLCDTLKVQLSGSISPYDLEDLMDADIQAAHAEEFKAPTMISKVGDAMPGLGIVAAVLGVVITMGKLTQGKEVIGHSVAAALVGTFIGILLSYGFMQPLATKMEANLDAEGKFIVVIKTCLLAFAKDCSPKVCVEFARRTIPPEARPTFQEVDQATASGGGAAKSGVI